MIDLMPNSTIFYQWMMFMLAVLILNFGIFRPALKVIMARRSATEGDEARAAEFEQKSSELKQQIEASMDEACRAGQVSIQQLRQEAEESSRDTIRQAREQMDAHLRKVRADVERESRGAELQLKQHAQSLAKDLARRILGRNIN